MLRKPYPIPNRYKPVKPVQTDQPVVKGLLNIGNKFRGISKTKELPELDVHDVVLLSMNNNEPLKDNTEEVQDNIQAAVDGVMKVEDLTRKANTGSKPGLPANKQVLIRATDEDHERWKSAAAELGVSLAEFVRDACNKAAGSMDCQHLPEHRKVYPWMQKCLNCGKRFNS